MNYRLVQDRFLPINETSGIIENEGYGYVEIAITDEEPIIDGKENIIIEKNGIASFKATGKQKVYGRSISYIVNDINVSVIEYDQGGSPVNAYTKEETDKLFVKKDGNKVLSDNNFTNEFKNKLTDLKAKMITFEDGETFQQKLNQGKLKGDKGDKGLSAYDIAKEDGFEGTKSQFLYSLQAQAPLEPITVKLTKDSRGLNCEYIGETNIVAEYVSNEVIIQTQSNEASVLNKMIIKNLPKGATHVRSDLISFFGVNDDGRIMGSTNPFRIGDGRTDLYPHMKLIDPTKDIKFDITGGSAEITLDLTYQGFTSKELEDMQKNLENDPTRVGFVQFKLAILKGEEQIGSIEIRHHFVKTVDTQATQLISLDELKPKTIDGNTVDKLTSYVKAEEYQPITPTDSLILALGKLEKGLENKSQPVGIKHIGREFKIHYCTEMEYQALEKIQDDTTVYMILNEITGEITVKCYRP